MSLKTLVVVSFSLTACAAAPMQRPPAEAPGPEILEVRMTDSSLELSSRRVAAGRVTFDVADDGLLEHTLRFEGEGLDEPADTSVASGQHRRISLKLKPGTYKVFCPDGDHAAKGMSAELLVQAEVESFHR